MVRTRGVCGAYMCVVFVCLGGSVVTVTQIMALRSSTNSAGTVVWFRWEDGKVSLDGDGLHESTRIVVEIAIFSPHIVVFVNRTSIASRGSTRVCQPFLEDGCRQCELERFRATHAHDAKWPRDDVSITVFDSSYAASHPFRR